MRYLSFILLILTCISCDYFQSKQQGKEVTLAEAEGKMLYLSEVKNIFSAGITPEDSLELLKNYVYNWTYRCVMAAKAEQALDKKQLDIAKEIDDYRMSLLAYRYELFCIQKQLDTLIADDELLAYYEKNSSPLPVTLTPRVRIVYIKIKETAGGLNNLRNALLGNKDRQTLDSLCMIMEAQPNYMDNQWIAVDDIPGMFPFSKERCDVAIRNNVSMLEEAGGGYVYLLGIRDIRRKPEYPSVTQLREQYYTTIINQRRMELLKKIEKDAYNDALDSQRVKIYINE